MACTCYRNHTGPGLCACENLIPVRPTPVIPAYGQIMGGLVNVIGNLLRRRPVTVQPGNAVLSAPALIATSNGPTVTLQWSSVVGATAYLAERSANNGASWSLLPSVVVTNLTDSPSPAGVYLYRVHATGAGQIGALSSVATATVTAANVPEIGTGPSTITLKYRYDAEASLFSVRALVAPNGDEITLRIEQQNGAAITGFGVLSAAVSSNASIIGTVDPDVDENTNRTWFFDGGTGKTGITNPAVKLTVRNSRTAQTAVLYRTLTASGTLLTGAWVSDNPPVNQTVPPAAPTSLMATVQSATSIALLWPAVVGATGYVLQFRTSTTGAWNTIGGTLTTPGYTHTGLLATTQYYYQVKAVADTLSSDFASTSATTLAAVVLPPAAPASLTATPASFSAINLSWPAVTDATGYILQFRISPQGTWASIGGTLTATSYAHTGLSASATYYYQIKAVKDLLSSGYVSAQANTLDAPVVPPPGPPASLTALATGPSAVVLSWPAVTGATSYELQTRTSTNSPWVGIGGTITGLTYTHEGLSSETVYLYQVRSVSTVTGNSTVWTAAQAATPAIVLPLPPVTASAVANSAQDITITWAARAGATGYELEYRVGSTASWIALNPVGTNTTFNHLALAGNTTYQYRIRTVANGLVSTNRLAQATTKLVAVTGFAATPTGTTSVRLTWNTVPGALFFDIDRSLDGVMFSPYVSLDFDELLVDSTGLTPSTTYYYRIYARNESSTSLGSQTQATTQALAALTAPSNFLATRTKTKVTLSWNAVPTATGYLIERSLTGTTNWTTVVSSTTALTIDDNDREVGTKYYYRIATRRNTTTSGYAQLDVTTLSGGMNVSSHPASLTLGQQVTLIATPDPEMALPTGYTIGWRRKTLSSGVIGAGVTGASTVVTGASNIALYSYFATLYNAQGVELDRSEEVTFTFNASGIAPPAGNKDDTPFMTALGYNLVIDNGVHVGNIVVKSDTPLEWRLLVGGAVVPGAGWSNANQFNIPITADQTFVPGSPTYDTRYRMDAATAGDTGVKAGVEYTLQFQRISDRSTYNEFIFTPVLTAQPVAIPLGNGTQGASQIQAFAQATWEYTTANTGTTTVSPTAVAVASRRWVGLNMYLDGVGTNGTLEDRDIQMLEHSASKGMNFVRVALNWSQIEASVVGTLDFRKIDDIGTRAKTLGLPILWGFNMTRSSTFNTTSTGGQFIPDAESVYDIDGVIHKDADCYQYSFASTTMRTRAAQFVTACINHIQSQPYGTQSMLWSLTTNPRAEAGHSWKNLVNGNDKITVYDFGPAAKAGFRTWAQAQSKFPNIAAVNSAWGTGFANFAAIQPPPLNENNGYYGYSTQYQLDWYVFTEQSIADTMLAFRSTVTGLIPGAKVIVEDGSFFDLRSISQRHTGTLAARLGAIEGIKQNGEVAYSAQTMRRSLSVSMRDWSATRIAGDEIGFDLNGGVTGWRDYLLSFWQMGGHLCTVANFYSPFLDLTQTKARITDLMSSTVTTALAVPVTNQKDGDYNANVRRFITGGGWQDTSPQMMVELEAVAGDKTAINWDFSTM